MLRGQRSQSRVSTPVPTKFRQELWDPAGGCCGITHTQRFPVQELGSGNLVGNLARSCPRNQGPDLVPGLFYFTHQNVPAQGGWCFFNGPWAFWPGPAALQRLKSSYRSSAHSVRFQQPASWRGVGSIVWGCRLFASRRRCAVRGSNRWTDEAARTFRRSRDDFTIKSCRSVQSSSLTEPKRVSCIYFT